MTDMNALNLMTMALWLLGAPFSATFPENLSANPHTIAKIDAFIAPRAYSASVMHWASYYGVPLDIAVRLAYEESRWDENAMHRNRNGTYDHGLYQLNSRYYRVGGPGRDIRLGLGHLASMYRITGTWRKAVIAYNAGASRVLNPPASSHRLADRVVGGGL